MKRKLDQIAGHNLWDLEIEDWINHCGLHPDDARMWTILRWMYWGEALAHEYPRVSAVAVTSMSGQSFAEALDRAIKRSEAPLPLPAPAPTIEHDPEEMK